MMPTLMGVVIHENVEPGVIDNALLKKCILEQGPRGEAGRLFAEEGVHLEEVESLRLEFLNILRIDHLWALDSLTKLSLSHNQIEKIVNLEQLTGLVELDLSFNKIDKLENLEALVNLEVLSLCHNKITTLENMDNLEQLLIFSIADNLISDYKEATYLRRFRKLRSVSIKRNPCCNDYMSYKFFKMVLKDVIYLDYFKIKDDERFDSYFSPYFRVLEEKEAIIEKARIEKEEYDTRVKHFAVSFVEYLSGHEYFETMFKEDKNGLILLKVGGEILEHYNTYKEQYVEAMAKLVEEAQAQHVCRQEEIGAFKDIFNAALQASIKRSKIIVDTFKEGKLALTSLFEDIVEAVNCKAKTLEEVDEMVINLGVQYNDYLFDLWKNLMFEEMTFFEQTDEMRVQFAVNITELVNKILDPSRNAFGAWREMESNWTIKQGEVMTKHVGIPMQTGENARELTYFFSERDILMDVIAQSTDQHVRFIDAREDLLISRATQWKEDTVGRTNSEEIQRNRGRVMEINYFIDNQRDDWAEIQMKLSCGPDAETAALLGDDY